MKKYVIPCALILLLGLVLTACGSGSGANDEDIVPGKYIPILGETNGVAVPGEALDFVIELTEDGKGTLTVSGQPSELTWKLEGDTMTLTEQGGDIVGKRGRNSMIFDDMFGMGVKVSFAREGTDACNTKYYLPEADQYLVGTWKSNDVTDVLGDLIDPEKMKPDALTLTIRGDYTADVTVEGKEFSGIRWMNEIDLGYLDSANVNITWTTTDDGLLVEYANEEGDYIFYCPKEDEQQ